MAQPNPPSARWPLITLVVVGWLLRSPWLFGLGDPWTHVDDSFLTENAAALAFEGRLGPVSNYYPALAHYPHALLLRIWKLCGGTLRGLNPEAAWSTTLHLMRLAQALLGSATIAVVFALGVRVGVSPVGGRQIGLLSAALLAFAPYHIAWSQILKPAISLALWSCLACLAALRYIDRPGLGRAVVTGLAIGSAVSTVYNGVTAGVFMVVAALLANGSRRARVGHTVAAGMASLAAFSIWNPYFVPYPNWYLLTIFGFAQDYGGKEVGKGLGVAQLLFYAIDIIPRAFLGWFAGSVFFVGLGLTLHRLLGGRRRAGFAPLALIASFVVAHIATTIAMTQLWLPHHFAPIIPFLAVIASVGVDHLGRRWLGPTRSWFGRATAGFALLAGLALPVYWSHRATAIRTPLEAAFDELQEIAVDGQQILTVGVDPGLSPLARPLDRLAAAGGSIVAGATWLVAPVRAVRQACAADAPDSALRRILVSTSVRLDRVVGPKPFRRVGGAAAIYRVEPCPWLEIDVIELPRSDFATSGDAGRDELTVWVRGFGPHEDSVDDSARDSADRLEPGRVEATPRVDLPVGPELRAVLEIHAAGDDFGLVVPGTRLGVGLGLEDERIAAAAPSHRDLELHNQADYTSEPLAYRSPRPTLAVRYDGAPGGRVYFTRARVRVVLPAANLAPLELAAARIREVSAQACAPAGTD